MRCFVAPPVGRPAGVLAATTVLVLTGCLATPNTGGDGLFSTTGGALTPGEAADGGTSPDASATKPFLQIGASPWLSLCFDGACPAAYSCSVQTSSTGEPVKVCLPPLGTSCADAAACNDGNDCTTDACDKAIGCVYQYPLDLACSDGNGCTTGEKCVLGKCAGGLPQDVMCDDADVCTTDACDPGLGCVHAPIAGCTPPPVPINNAQPPVQPSEAGGAFRTQTPGGWGGVCFGNNPACYRDYWFPTCFPDGLTAGACGNTTEPLGSAQIATLLPTGGTPGALPDGGVLLGHVVSTALSVGFDACNPGFGSSSTALGALVACKGQPCEGMTVAAMLEAGHQALGGCSGAPLSAEAINTCLTKVNEAWVDGVKDNKFLCLP